MKENFSNLFKEKFKKISKNFKKLERKFSKKFQREVEDIFRQCNIFSDSVREFQKFSNRTFREFQRVSKNCKEKFPKVFESFLKLQRGSENFHKENCETVVESF